MNRLDRLTSILTHLQTKRTITAQELADRFQISLRTVYRDLRSLDEAGVPVIGEAGQGYSLVEGYRLPPVMFTKEEALAFLIAEKIVEKVTDRESSRHFQSALFKIKAVLKSTQKEAIDTLSSQVEVIPKPNGLLVAGRDRTLQILLQSLSEKRVISLAYTTFEQEVTTKRAVEPVGVYYSFDQWYLIAWCRLRNDYRTFRLDRIREVCICEETFYKHHPSLKDYLEKVKQEQQLTKVVLQVSYEGVKYMQIERYNQGFVFERKTGNGVEMTFMTCHLEGFARWAIMLGDYIQVIEPQELKSRIKALILIMLEKIEEKNRVY
ncbi:MAG TPA: YafY family protein [Lunatimonas sp.]|nr:YafY family protein [Lunatimonas sp.]